MTETAENFPAISDSIRIVQGQRVILDSSLAALYGVTTKRLNEQVKRNATRFPDDFMFRLSPEENAALDRSQFATGSARHRDPRFPPFAFTEHGAIQAANVLNSARAIAMGVLVVRAFIQLRELLISNKALAKKLEALESRFPAHDEAIAAILSTIRELIRAPMSLAAESASRPTWTKARARARSTPPCVHRCHRGDASRTVHYPRKCTSYRH